MLTAKRGKLTHLLTPGGCEWKNCVRIFCIAGILAAVLFLPFVVFDKGLFLLYGDYNVQQIPFYQLAHDAIRDGNLGWNWNTDLGANFIGSYSFYLLGSPFFWMTIPFPTEWLPYLMAPLFVLKFALTGVTGYAYIRRFTKTPQMAMIGGLLYAFSGYMIYNIFYNHFIEVVLFFPLLLIGLEEVVVDNRRGLFALAVAVNLLCNYYFFVAEVVFLVLYFVLRCTSLGFTITWRKFVALAVESILGGLMGMALLLPSALMVLQNPRVSGMLYGYNMLFYGKEQKYGLILQSLFFPPDMPAFPNFFPEADAKWYSVAAYLPMFGMAGTIAFLRDKRKSWLRGLLILLLIMVFVPFLNSAFNGFNGSFYTRWFYMLTLMMSLATVLALENRRVDILFGIKCNLAAVCAFAVIGLIPKEENGAVVWGDAPNYPIMFWINVAIALGGVALTWLICTRFRKNPRLLYRGGILALCGFIAVYAIGQLAWGKTRTSPDYYADIVDRGLNASFQLDESEFNRVDVYNDGYTDNWGMFWGLPAIQAFQSTVPASIMEFYPAMGISRDVATRIPAGEYDGLRAFLSVRYIFVENNDDNQIDNPNLPPGFVFYEHQNDFDIYENQHFLPMGFAYNHYLTEETWNSTDEKQRDRLLLKGVLLSGEQQKKYGDLLTALPAADAQALSDERLLEDTDRLRGTAADSFTTDNSGFSSIITLDQPNLVVYSVPYEEGWSATVNGQPAAVEKVDNGMMAVSCPAGACDIRLQYSTPGLTTGLLLTGGGILLFAGYLWLSRWLSRRKPALYAPTPDGWKQERFDDYTTPTHSQMAKWYERHRKR